MSRVHSLVSKSSAGSIKCNWGQAATRVAPDMRAQKAAIRHVLRGPAIQAKAIVSDPGNPEVPVRLPCRGGGTEMPEDVRATMETAFGVDFSPVRIHEGWHAPAVGALVYTQGTDIHFAPGQYQPTSRRGQELLGHELAHVVQQSQGRVRTTTQTKGVDINDDAALEREADEMAVRAARGQPRSAPAVNRSPSDASGTGQIFPKPALPSPGSHSVHSALQKAENDGAPGALRKPDSIVHPCIDVRAQFALLRLFERGGADEQTAIECFRAVDSGQIAGIFGDDLAVAAKMAARRETVRWQLVAAGQSATLIDDGLPDGPALLFREQVSGAALDSALLNTYRAAQTNLGPIPAGSAPRCGAAPAAAPPQTTPPNKVPPPSVPPRIVPPTPVPPQPGPPGTKLPPVGSCSTLLRPKGPSDTITGIGSRTHMVSLEAGTLVGVLLENLAPHPVTVELIDRRSGASVAGVIGPAPLWGAGPTAFHSFAAKGCVPLRWYIEIRLSASTSLTPPALPFAPPSITVPLPIRVHFSISSNSFPGEGPCCDV